MSEAEQELALKLAEAYRAADKCDDLAYGVMTHIRQAWCAVTGTSEWTMRNTIMEYGL